MKDFNNTQDLLQKPIWQMTGEEFLQLNQLSRSSADNSREEGQPTAYAHGIGELAQMIGCCQSTIYTLKKLGVLDEAIVSQIGKRIVFDVNKARILADGYQKSQREARRESK